MMTGGNPISGNLHIDDLCFPHVEQITTTRVDSLSFYLFIFLVCSSNVSGVLGSTPGFGLWGCVIQNQQFESMYVWKLNVWESMFNTFTANARCHFHVQAAKWERWLAKPLEQTWKVKRSKGRPCHSYHVPTYSYADSQIYQQSEPIFVFKRSSPQQLFHESSYVSYNHLSQSRNTWQSQW